MLTQYLCKSCYEYTYVFWHKPANPYCWKCGEFCVGETGKTYMMVKEFKHD